MLAARVRVLACAVGLSVLLAACGTAAAEDATDHATDQGAPSAPGADIGTKTDIALPAELATLPFRDSTGRLVHLRQFAGKVMVISDGMTLCQESCPLDTASLVASARAANRAGLGDKVVYLTITVDPVRDTTSQLAAYRRLFSPPPANWHLLTGSPADVDAFWDSIGVWRKKVAEADPQDPPKNWLTGKPLTYDVAHSDEVFFFDARQHDRFILEGVPHLPGKGSVPPRLYAYLNKEGRANLTSPSAEAWTVPQAVSVIAWLTRTDIPS